MNSDASDPALICIDWGTSSLRAYLMDAQGRVLDKLESPDGIHSDRCGATCGCSCTAWHRPRIATVLCYGRIAIVGGITPDRMAGYLTVGANGFGLGSAPFKPDYDMDELHKRATTFVSALAQYKTS